MPLFGHTKTLHTLTGMGSTVLVAAVPYPGKAIWISHKGQWITIKILKHAHTHTHTHTHNMHHFSYCTLASTQKMLPQRVMTQPSYRRTEPVWTNLCSPQPLCSVPTNKRSMCCFTHPSLAQSLGPHIATSRPPVRFYFLLLLIPV